jgi:hypothetical protein
MSDGPESDEDASFRLPAASSTAASARSHATVTRMRALTDELGSTSTTTERRAVAQRLAELCARTDADLLYSGLPHQALQHVLALLRSADVPSVVYGSVVVANYAFTPEGQQRAVRAGAVQVLLDLIHALAHSFPHARVGTDGGREGGAGADGAREGGEEYEAEQQAHRAMALRADHLSPELSTDRTERHSGERSGPRVSPRTAQPTAGAAATADTRGAADGADAGAGPAADTFQPSAKASATAALDGKEAGSDAAASPLGQSSPADERTVALAQALAALQNLTYFQARAARMVAKGRGGKGPLLLAQLLASGPNATVRQYAAGVLANLHVSGVPLNESLGGTEGGTSSHGSSRGAVLSIPQMLGLTGMIDALMGSDNKPSSAASSAQGTPTPILVRAPHAAAPMRPRQCSRANAAASMLAAAQPCPWGCVPPRLCTCVGCSHRHTHAPVARPRLCVSPRAISCLLPPAPSSPATRTPAPAPSSPASLPGPPGRHHSDPQRKDGGGGSPPPAGGVAWGAGQAAGGGHPAEAAGGAAAAGELAGRFEPVRMSTLAVPCRLLPQPAASVRGSRGFEGD